MSNKIKVALIGACAAITAANAGKPHKHCVFARCRRFFYSLFLGAFLVVDTEPLRYITVVQDKPEFRHIRHGRSQKSGQTGASAFPVSPFVKSNLRTAG